MRIKGETPHFLLKTRSFCVLVAENNKSLHPIKDFSEQKTPPINY